MKKSDWITILSFQIMLQMLFTWCIDVSISAMLNNGILTSGFITSQPMYMYHICLYASVLNLMLMAIIGIHHILKDQ